MENTKADFDKQWFGTTSAKVAKVAKSNRAYSVPMPTHKDIMTDNKVDYRVLSAINIKAHSTKGEEHRYIVKKDLDFETMAKELGLAKDTVRKTFNKLTKAECSVVEAVKTENGLTYKINYKTEGRYFICVNHNILRILANTTKENVLKTYLVLCYWLEEKNDRQISYEWLAEKIGLSTKGGRYRTTMKDIIFVLVSLNLISIELKPYYAYNEERDTTTQNYIYEFHLNTYEEFKTHYEKTMNKTLTN